MTSCTSTRRSCPRRPTFEAMEIRRLLSTVVVTTLADETIANSTTSLREAITQANAGDTIQWASTLSGTITLGGAGALHLTKNLTIQGRGAGPTGISGNNASRIFTVDGGVTATITSMTLFGGLAESGGAISNGGTLTLDSVLFSGSSAKADSASGRGGAIYNTGKLTATSCTFTNNTAQGDSGNDADGNGLPAYGGAIYNTGTLSLSSASFSNNVAAGGEGVFGSGTSVETQTYGDGGEAFGGAIYSAAGAGSITLSSTTFASNHANGGAGLDNFTRGGAGAAAWGGAVYTRSALTVTGGSWTGNGATAGNSGDGDFDAKDAGGAFGGAVWTNAALSFSNTLFGNNLAVGGAGGHVSEFFFGTAGGGATGGAIDSETADASFSACTFENNRATGGVNGGGASGGAIAKAGGKLTLTDSTFSANQAAGADSPEAFTMAGGSASGGAVSATGILSVTGSTFSGNGATAGAGSASGSLHGSDILPAPGGNALGGAIYTTSSSSTITRSTLFGNSATGGAGGSGITIPPPEHGGDALGGGIFAAGNLTLTADTIAGNSLVAGLGGEQVQGPNGASGQARGGGVSVGGTLTIANTIVATNSALVGPDVSTTSSVASQGFNLIGKTNGSTGWLATDKKGASASPLNPKLGSLTNNGGPTSTMALLSGSPALDAGKAFGLTSDQRGFVRTFNLVNVANAVGGDGTDIGAFELQSTPFSGTPIAINSSGSSTIQAENFDKGDDGIAYHDVESKNLGNVYRTSSGVDIQATTDTGGGYNVGWTRAGEWLNYSVNVGASGNYDFTFRVASAGAGGKFHLEVDGNNATGPLSVPNTGGWQTFVDLKKSGVAVTSGRHVLRLVMDSVGATGAIGNFNYIKIAPAATQQPIVIKSTTAAYVRDGTFANNNFGNASDLLAKKSTTSYNRETYIKFDLSGAATIASAKLRLFGNLADANASSITVGIFAAPSTWDESTIVWNTRPATTSQLASFTVSGTNAKTYEIDLTNFLKSEKAAGHNTVTIVLKSLTTSATAATFASDETANGPQLSIVT